MHAPLSQHQNGTKKQLPIIWLFYFVLYIHVFFFGAFEYNLVQGENVSRGLVRPEQNHGERENNRE